MEKSPDAFRTISEVAEFLETPAHVLRFWESRFPQIRPVKRAGGRRYYRPADVALLTGIKRLLHEEGMTIRGVQKILREQGVRYVSGIADDTSDTISPDQDDGAALTAALAEAGDQNEKPAAAPPLPPAEAEKAQVIALQDALRDRALAAEAEMGDLFASAAKVPEAENPITVAADADIPRPDKPVDPAPVDEPDAVEEAPMALWAEPEDDDQAATARLPEMKVTRIGQAPQVETSPPAEPDTADDTLRPTLATRLRQLSPDAFSPADRATITLVRARARSLRDRLSSPARSGF